MTQERFLKLLDNPALLTTISYEELKTLALAYPYAHNLRSLLAIKAQQSNHPEASRTLAAAAANSLDRTRLFMLVAPKIVAPQRLEAIREEVLELKPIETIKRELDALSPLTRDERPSALPRPSLPVPPPVGSKPPATDVALDFSQAISLPPEPVESPVTEPEPVELEPAAELPTPSLSEQEPAVEPSVAAPLPDEVELANEYEEVMTASETESELPIEPEPVAYPAPQAFTHWMEQFQLPTLEPRPARPARAVPAMAPATQPSAKPEPVAKTGIAHVLAEKSVSENKDVLSETLARIYVQQGHREKAIQMYQRLSLAFPEKSAYFAAEIDKLKN